jgi:hypothetical protein
MIAATVAVFSRSNVVASIAAIQNSSIIIELI